MKFLEKHLEQIIWESSDSQLDNVNLPISGKRYRQLKIGNYGIADIVTVRRTHAVDYNKMITRYDRNIFYITVYELKRDIVNVNSFLQAINYVLGIKRYLKKRGIFEKHKFIFSIVLIGESVEKDSSFIYLPELLSINNDDDDYELYYTETGLDLSIYTYTYNIDGICFELQSDYYLTKEGF